MFTKFLTSDSYSSSPHPIVCIWHNATFTINIFQSRQQLRWQEQNEISLRFGGHRLPRVVYFNMFIMIRLIAASFAANIARERSRPAMYPHVFRQVVAPMETFAAIRDLAHVSLCHFVFFHVSLAIVLPNKLTAAIVASVRADRFVRIHMGDVFWLSYEGSFAQTTFKRFRGATHVHPSVQFEVPLGAEWLVAYDADEGSLPAVR